MEASGAVIDELVEEEEEAEAEETSEDAELPTGDQGELAEGEEEPHPSHEHLAEPPEEVTSPPMEEAARAAGVVKITEIEGVPLFYERDAAGSRPHEFFVASSFFPVLRATVLQVKRRAPAQFGKPVKITSGGMRVTTSDLMHVPGRACDWDRFTFANVEIAPIDRDHKSQSVKDRRRYWALAAICRSNSCFVLHGEYDANHQDHIHADDTLSPAFNTKDSTVKLVKAVLNEIFGETPKLPIVSGWDAQAQEAAKRATQRVQLQGDIRTDLDTFRRFLRRSGRLGFKLSV